MPPKRRFQRYQPPAARKAVVQAKKPEEKAPKKKEHAPKPPASGPSSEHKGPTIVVSNQVVATTLVTIQDYKWQIDTSIVYSQTIQDFMNSIVFNGFDMKGMLEVLIQAEPDVDTLKSEISSLLAIYVERGTNITKMMNRMDDDAAEEVAEYANKYGVSDNASAAGKTGVTLGRLAAAFPLTVMSILYARQNVRVIGSRGRLKAHWCFPAAAALLPTMDIADPLVAAWFAWNESFTEVITGEEADKDQLVTFANIAFSNSTVAIGLRAGGSALAMLKDAFDA